jgi:hypothetical protein
MPKYRLSGNDASGFIRAGNFFTDSFQRIFFFPDVVLLNVRTLAMLT